MLVAKSKMHNEFSEKLLVNRNFNCVDKPRRSPLESESLTNHSEQQPPAGQH